MRRPTVQAVLLCAVVALAAACGSSTPTTPTPPTLTTDTFTGTLNRNGANTHQFSASTSGPVTATLTGLAPDSSKAIGFSMGIQLAATCQIVLDNPTAVQGAVLGQGAQATTQGTFCVRVYDVGNITDATGPFSYTISVTHP